MSKWLPVDATVPLMNPYRDHMLLPFDNLGGASASVSLANSDDDPMTVNVTILNENGAEIAKEGKFTLAPHEAGTYVLAREMAFVGGAARAGVARLRGRAAVCDGAAVVGQGLLLVSGRGVRRDGRGPGATDGQRRRLVAIDGLSRQRDVVRAIGLLRLWPDKTRFSGQSLSDESAPVVPGNGMLMWQAPCKDTSKAGGDGSKAGIRSK